jgi:hypothetical protein
LDSCTATSDQDVYIPFTPTAGQPQEAYFKVNFGDFTDSSGAKNFLQFTATATSRAIYTISSTKKLTAAAGGGSAGFTINGISASTTYHIWIKYLKVQTSNDAYASIQFSTDGTKPGCPSDYCAESINGTGTSDPNRLHLLADYTGAGNCTAPIIDHVRIDDAAIGSNPF